MLECKVMERAVELEKRLKLSFLPTRASEGSNGYDLRACIDEPVVMKLGDVYKFPTGIAIDLGKLRLDSGSTAFIEFAGLLLPRSSTPGLVLENTIGLVDADYQGEIFLKYRSRSEDQIVIKPGDRIGQLLIVLSYLTEAKKVVEFTRETARGNGGFGSTGVM